MPEEVVFGDHVCVRPQNFTFSLGGVRLRALEDVQVPMRMISFVLSLDILQL